MQFPDSVTAWMDDSTQKSTGPEMRYFFLLVNEEENDFGIVHVERGVIISCQIPNHQVGKYLKIKKYNHK